MEKCVQQEEGLKDQVPISVSVEKMWKTQLFLADTFPTYIYLLLIFFPGFGWTASQIFA